MVEIRFRNLWRGTTATNEFLDELLRRSCDQWSPSRGYLDVQCALPFTSTAQKAVAFAKSRMSSDATTQYRQLLTYGIAKPDDAAEKRVWYSGENLRPPRDVDASLSFDLDEFDGSNLYLPFWVTLFRHSTFTTLSAKHDSQVLTQPRRITDWGNRKFCAVIMSNPHPHRLRAIESLRRIGNVDVFGRGLGRPVTDKIGLLREYRFCISFENDLYPGYVTEKAFDSWLAGSVPIYWGDDAAGSLNSDAVIEYKSGAGGWKSLVERVDAANRDEEDWIQLASRPILRNAFDLATVETKLRELLS